jgi:hypothetical protein
MLHMLCCTGRIFELKVRLWHNIWFSKWFQGTDFAVVARYLIEELPAHFFISTRSEDGTLHIVCSFTFLPGQGDVGGN